MNHLNFLWEKDEEFMTEVFKLKPKQEKQIHLIVTDYLSHFLRLLRKKKHLSTAFTKRLHTVDIII